MLTCKFRHKVNGLTWLKFCNNDYCLFRSGIESGNGHDIYIDNENENLTKSPYRYIYLNSCYKYFCCIDNNNEDLAKRVYNYIIIMEFFCYVNSHL